MGRKVYKDNTWILLLVLGESKYTKIWRNKKSEYHYYQKNPY